MGFLKMFCLFFLADQKSKSKRVKGDLNLKFNATLPARFALSSCVFDMRMCLALPDYNFYINWFFFALCFSILLF